MLRRSRVKTENPFSRRPQASHFRAPAGAFSPSPSIAGAFCGCVREKTDFAVVRLACCSVWMDGVNLGLRPAVRGWPRSRIVSWPGGEVRGLMVNNVCAWFPYRVMQRSGVVERVLGKKPTNAKDRVCVARPDLAPAASPPSFVSHVLRGLVWGGWGGGGPWCLCRHVYAPGL